METQAYIVFGTMRNSTGEKREPAGPWRVYAVSTRGPPSYARLMRSEQGGVRWYDLRKGTNEFNKIDKWVCRRGILSVPDARCHVSKHVAYTLLERLEFSFEELH